MRELRRVVAGLFVSDGGQFYFGGSHIPLHSCTYELCESTMDPMFFWKTKVKPATEEEARKHCEKMKRDFAFEMDRLGVRQPSQPGRQRQANAIKLKANLTNDTGVTVLMALAARPNLFLTAGDAIVDLNHVIAIEVTDAQVKYSCATGVVIISSHRSHESATEEKWAAYQQIRSR
jgi:hypothetical protein